jgi:glycosyltransferase involved in cell wall biosynthesis
MANYNHAHYISEALDAILSQSRRPDEVIIIDDASTDNSIEVIEKFAQRDPIIHLIRNEKNMGPLLSSEKAMNHIHGTYVYFAAADDRVLPGFFEKSLALLQRYPQAGLCSANTSRIGDKTSRPCNVRVEKPHILPYTPPDRLMDNFHHYGWYLWGHSVVIKRSVFIEAGGLKTELGPLSDAFIFHLAAFSTGACYIPETLTTHRVDKKRYSDLMLSKCENALMIHAHYLYSMRSPEYSTIVPPEYVTYCRREFARMLRGYLKTEIYCYQQALMERISQIKAGKLSYDTVLLRGLKFLMKCERFLSFIYCNRNFEDELEEASHQFSANTPTPLQANAQK